MNLWRVGGLLAVMASALVVAWCVLTAAEVAGITSGITLQRLLWMAVAGAFCAAAADELVQASCVRSPLFRAVILGVAVAVVGLLGATLYLVGQAFVSAP